MKNFAKSNVIKKELSKSNIAMKPFVKSKERVFVVAQEFLKTKQITKQQILHTLEEAVKAKEKVGCSVPNPLAFRIHLEDKREFGKVKTMVCKHHKDETTCFRLPDGTPIKGFNIEPGDLETLIQPSPPEMFPRACRILVAFAKKFDRVKEYTTIIFFRIGNDNKILKDLAYEFCLPCPDTCPEDFIEKADDGSNNPNYICRDSTS